MALVERITTEREQEIRHLARFRVCFKGEEDWADESPEFLFYDDAVGWCYAEANRYGTFLPDEYTVHKSYDGGKTWQHCGDLRWDLVTMKAHGTAEDFGEMPLFPDPETLM